MNHYTQILYHLKNLAENHPLVNTVTKGDASKLDLTKANIFPLVHITIEEGGFVNGSIVRFNVTIECVTERDLNKEIVADKFWRQDNEVDNHNETLAILNYLWTYIYRDWNQDNISTSENGSFDKIEFEKGNILDGWALTFTVDVPNTQLTLCEITFDDIEGVISSGTGGSVLPGEGTFSYTYGSNNAFYALADTGYRFLKWLYSGVQSLVNPIAIRALESFTLAAQFMKIWNVTIADDGNGTVSGATSGTYDDGTQLTLTAVPDDPETYEFTEFDIGGDIIATNPYTYTVESDISIIAYFNALFTTILDIFSTDTELNTGEYKWIDLTDFSNDCVSKQQVLTLNGIDQAVYTTSKEIALANTFYLEHEFITGATIPSQNFVGQAYTLQQGIFTNGVDLQYRFFPGSVQNAHNEAGVMQPNTYYKVAVDYNGTTIKYYLYDVEIYSNAATGVVQDAGGRFAVGCNTNNVVFSNWSNTKLIRTQLTVNGAKRLDWVYNTGVLNYIVNRDGAGANGTIKNYVTSMWDNFSSLFKSLARTNGATIYIKNSDSSKIAIIGDVSKVITDYTKDAYEAPYIGLLEGVSELVTIPVNTELNTLVPAGDYTWKNIDDLVESENIIKTKVGNIFTRFVVKKKLTDLIDVLDNITVLTNESVLT